MSEWVEVIKQSIVGVIVSIVIGVAFGFVYMSMTSANRNKDKIATTLAAAEQKDLQAYDGTLISGEQARTAIAQYEGTEYAVFLKTAKSGNYANFCALAANVSDPFNASSALQVTVDKQNSVMSQNQNTYVNLQPGPNGESFTNSTLKVGLTSSINHKLYINPTTRFYSCVLRDENGSIRGLAFVQVSASN